MKKPFWIDTFRGLRYWPVGMTAGITDTVVVMLCLYLWGRSWGVEASLMGALFGYPISFIGHRYFTFGSTYTPLGRQLLTYIVLKSPNVLARVFLFHELFVENRVTSNIGWVVPIFIWNFSMKRWIFTGTPPWRKAAE
jgi:putative flippase GtrA